MFGKKANREAARIKASREWQEKVFGRKRQEALEVLKTEAIKKLTPQVPKFKIGEEVTVNGEPDNIKIVFEVIDNINEPLRSWNSGMFPQWLVRRPSYTFDFEPPDHEKNWTIRECRYSYKLMSYVLLNKWKYFAEVPETDIHKLYTTEEIIAKTN